MFSCLFFVLFFFSSMHLCMEWQVVFPEAFLKDIMIWHLEVSLGMQLFLFGEGNWNQ